MNSSKVLLAYVPVLHRGYCEFFGRHSDAEAIFILGPELVAESDHFRKDIRALDPRYVRKALEAWGFSRVVIAQPSHLRVLNGEEAKVVMPQENVSYRLKTKYLPNCTCEFDNIFLRRDKKRTISRDVVDPNWTVSTDEFDRQMMALAEDESKKSPDWWRRIGALAFRDGEVLAVAYNTYVPSPHTAYAFGDPRLHFKAGVEIELSSAIHAEAALIACAASRENLSLRGASLYVTTFPCPPCAKLVAYSGVDRVYFRDGYSRLDAQSILEAKSVEIVRVQT